VEIEITILNWEKYNPQNFQTRYPHWFRLNKEITRSQTLLDLTAEEKWVWVTLLCVACQRSSAKFQTTLKWLSREADVSIQSIENTLKKLVTANGLAINWQLTGREIGNQLAPTEHNNTVQNITKEGARNFQSSVEMAAPSGRGPKDLVPKAGSEAKEVIAHYCDEYKKRYGGFPTITGKTAGQVTQLLKYVSASKAKDLLSVYLQTEDPWFLKIKHRFSDFLTNLESIGASLESGKAVGIPEKQKTWWELVQEEEKQNAERNIRETNLETGISVEKQLRGGTKKTSLERV